MTKDLKENGSKAKQKVYRTPKLVEFGSITDLTRNNATSITPEGSGTGNEAKKVHK